ncbi:la-related protein 7 [Diorhabda carinulata]|uniref:la-related protein 7 n=1 Tax=Diorhabda carinulata TaxID=1163345 RepID=UPI0025A02D44|nr:la-related protein 7 [Diorhabda carinulata]
MEESEYEVTKISKKGRHRKKLLYKSILQLMEFYFSDSNLAKDRFLSQLINDDPYVDLNIFLKFNKIKKLNCTIDDIRKAIGKSDLIELSENKEKIKRKLPIKIKDNVDLCTVYIENIPADADHDWISNIFSDFGKVVYVSIPKYKHNKTNKGFAFVEFEDEIGAKSALGYFESIGCKMPSETSPEQLKSIRTFEEKTSENQLTKKYEEKPNNEETKEPNTNLKRNLEDEPEIVNKKIKLDTDQQKTKSAVENAENIDADHLERKNSVENAETLDTDNKKKKKHKKDKKKIVIRELGLQVLLKPEWKKMRNRYLDLQKKQMREFKQYLHKQKYNQRNFDGPKKNYSENTDNSQENIKNDETTKVEFVKGVIVKVKLPETVVDTKKIKTEVKASSSDIKYVDVPLPTGNEIFIRFSNDESAKEFCTKDFFGEKTVLEGDDERAYWEKINNDRNVKYLKNVKKQRGRDKLLKKAEKLMATHIKFDDGE